ncbi:HEAT repeat domain-containing protein [Deinococcus radiotolerans]|uniref:HEAT repeat domain-containing protein n=1 Tax=Deinococcus radiotolerans TaxID=1309407 RepID=UPI001669E270|nr:HEAT repeat domain-containing protein [Deinococcus radiotolerans]
MQLDGLNGLRQIVQDQHRFTATSPDASHHPYVWEARTLLGDDAVESELKNLPEALRPRGNADRARKRKQQKASNPRPTDAYQHVHMLIHDAVQPRLHPVSMLPYQLIHRLTPPDWQRLTTDLNTEDPAKLRLLLSLFMRHGVPGALRRLLSLVRHEDNGVAFRALRALGHIQHERVREFALELLRTPQRFSEEATSLLRLNYRPGDEQLICMQLNGLQEQLKAGERQSFLRNVADIAEQFPDEGLLKLLTGAFPQQPCACCRERMLAVLIEHDAAPPDLLAEARLDASPEVRSLATEALSAAGRLR